MKNSIIYHSYSGNTRSVASRIAEACGGRLVEVMSLEYSSRLSAYTIGCYRARKGLGDRIVPAEIDVSADDVIVIGTPVWAGRATPAINGAVAALRGCEGKPAVIFATAGGKDQEALPILATALVARGMKVTGQFVFDRAGLEDEGRIGMLISAIRKAAGVQS